MTLSATAQRYYPNAIQMPGPPANVYPDANQVEGVVCHSAEGDWSPTYQPTDTMIQRGVSWPFTVFKDGRVEQHYALDASCWHAGSGTHNRSKVGIEHEGRAGEPLTEVQTAASVALVRWIALTAGWSGLTRRVTLWEHNEVTTTTCPNGRIPWHRYVSPVTPQPPVSGTAPIVTPLPGGEFLPEPVEARDIGQIAADLVYGVQSGRVDLVSHGPSPKRAGWTRLTVDYL